MEQLVIRWIKDMLTEAENKSKHKYNGFPRYCINISAFDTAKHSSPDIREKKTSCTEG